MNELTHKDYCDGYLSYADAVRAGGMIYALSEVKKYSRPDMAVGHRTTAFAAGMIDGALAHVQGQVTLCGAGLIHG